MMQSLDLRIYVNQSTYFINKPVITEYTNQYIKLSDCESLHDDILDHELFRTCDLYFIPQNLTFFSSFVDLVATFGKTHLPHCPVFEEVFFGSNHESNVTLSLPGIDYKIYIAPKYTYAGNDFSFSDFGSHYIDFISVVKPWHKTKEEQHGASYTNDFLTWLESKGYDQVVTESLRHLYRTITITHSDILPALYHCNYRVDLSGNVIFFNPFRRA